MRAGIPRFAPRARAANQAPVDQLAAIGRTRGATPAQVELSADDLAQMDAAAAGIAIVGERHPEALDRLVDR